MNFQYSIVVCTYNPDENILKKCLDSIQQLELTDIATEVIIVDNNSHLPLVDRTYVQEFCKAVSYARVVTENNQGLVYARICGIEQAKGDWVIFFDDDNQVAADYIQELRKLNAAFPNVGAWGPGNITVNFIDGVDIKRERHLRPVFQERHAKNIEFASNIDWQPCYPFGTGLCVRRDILLEYASLIKSKTLTLVGRNSKGLGGGEDMQIVLVTIKKGYAAGHSPSLQVVHIIPKERLTDAYIKKLIYNNTIFYFPSHSEVFPHYLKELEKRQHGPFKFTIKVIRKVLKAYLTNNYKRTLDLIGYIGYMSGSYFALGTPIPRIVKWISKRLEIV